MDDAGSRTGRLRAAARAEALTASRFAIVGLAATAVHAAVALLLALPDILAPLIANTVAFLTAFGVSFAGHHFWSFPQTAAGQSRWRARLPRFFLLAVAGFAANSGVLAAWLAFTPWPKGLGILLAICIIPAVTFLGARLWAFAEPTRRP